VRGVVRTAPHRTGGARNDDTRPHPISGPHAPPDWTQKHVSKICLRTRNKKGHSIAVGAVARHLAESTFWVLTKAEPYKNPEAVPPRQG
jgi:hypothetical protein